MNIETESIENAIYAIIGFPKNDLEALENNFEYPVKFEGINGTCFFVTPNKFITAHHCLNKNFAEEQTYFLINKNGHIINGINIECEDSKTDICIGKIDTSINTFCKIPNKPLALKQDQKFTAYGFSNNDTQNFRLKIKKENNKIEIVEHDSLILKKIEYNYVQQHLLKSHLSSDANPIHLIDCDVFLFDTSLEVGFSGGPTFNNETNETIGFASQDIFCENLKNPLMIIIPIVGEIN